MSLFPNVEGVGGVQSCCGAGLVGGDVTLAWALARHVSSAEQSAPLRVSFHTAAPYVGAATA